MNTDALGQPVTDTVSQTPSLSSHDEPRPDGSSNTFMYAEKYQLEDDAYVLTAIQHGSVDTLQTGSIAGVLVAFGDVGGATDTFEFGYYDGGTQQDSPTSGQAHGSWIRRAKPGPTSCTKMCLCRRSKPGPQ